MTDGKILFEKMEQVHFCKKKYFNYSLLIDYDNI